MNKSKGVDIIAAIISLIGLFIQVKYDSRGLYIVLLGLAISIINQLIKGRNKEEATSEQ
ncbi:MAG: hypothetical protein AAF985_25540 [Bacteroidota bacterium]